MQQDQRSKLRVVLTTLLSNIDVDTLEYFESMIMDSSANSIDFDRDVLKEMLAPFIESYGIAEDLEGAIKICDSLYTEFISMGVIDASNDNQYSSDNDVKLLDKSVTLSDLTNILSESEKSAVENMWGFESIRKKRNEIMEVNEAGSAKYERKAANEQKKWLKDLDSKLNTEDDEGADSDEENNQISAMTLPDLSGNNREKDIHVNNVTITYGGRILLDNADLRLVFGRRYGLIGRNGIGKTTLLKHMANFDIEGFPRYLH
jgi:ATP-binding cassette subfamily F protein 3